MRLSRLPIIIITRPAPTLFINPRPEGYGSRFVVHSFILSTAVFEDLACVEAKAEVLVTC